MVVLNLGCLGGKNRSKPKPRCSLLKYLGIALLLLAFLPFPLFSDAARADDRKNSKNTNSFGVLGVAG